MKKGFSLLELILAIVIIAIAVSALPTIVGQTQKSNEFALKQELIFHAKSMIINVTRYPWDSNAYEQECVLRGKNAGCGDINDIRLPIYHITGGSLNDRPGILNSTVSRYPFRAQPSEDYTPASKGNFRATSYGEYVFNGVRLNDLDDFDGYAIESIRAAIDEGDFVTNANLTVTVDYINDNLIRGDYLNSQEIEIVFPNEQNIASNDPSNIKRVRVDAIDVDTGLVVSMYAYSFNIGDNPDIPSKSAR